LFPVRLPRTLQPPRLGPIPLGGAGLATAAGLLLGWLLLSPLEGAGDWAWLAVPGLAFGLQGLGLGLRFAPDAPGGERDALSDGLPRRQRERIYTTLAQFAHCHGAVDALERDALEALRTRFGLRPAEAKALERAGRRQTRVHVSEHLAERTLLVDSVVGLANRKPSLSRSEQRFVRQLLAAVDRRAETWR